MARNRTFQRRWARLVAAFPDDERSELAATLYLWANEAWRLGIRYW